LFWIANLYKAWYHIPKEQWNEPLTQRSFSIIIAIRNEEENLQKLFDSLRKINYPLHLFEIIFVNDHSEDSSITLIESFVKENTDLQIHLINLSPQENGKKVALQKAYALSQYELLLMTDGDCQVPKDWISITNQYFHNSAIKMLLGGIRIVAYPHFIQKFQALDVLAMIGSSAGAVALNNPIMNKGANLALGKSILSTIDMAALRTEMASGDDLFMLHETVKVYGAKSVRFIKESAHFVDTIAQDSFSELIHQRLRWVSKSKAYSQWFLIATSLVIFFQNISLVLLFFYGIYNSQFLLVFIQIILIKMAIDYFFLKNISSFVGQKKLMAAYPLTAIIYPFFVSFTAIAGQFSSFKWKNRRHQK